MVLANRNYLNEFLEILIPTAKEKIVNLHFILDLDNFKTINDSLGHHIGDELLLNVSDVLKSSKTNDFIAKSWR